MTGAPPQVANQRISLAQLHLYVDVHLLEQWFALPFTLFVAALLASWVSIWKVVVWVLLELAIIAVLVITCRTFKRVDPAFDEEPRWFRQIALAHGAHALAWASLPLWAAQPGDFKSLMLIMLVQVGLVSVAVVMSNAHRGLLFMDLAPPALALVGTPLLYKGWFNLGLGMLCMAYVALMLLLGLRIHAATTAALRLRLRNEELIIELERQATQDALTGVASRRSILQSGRTEIQRSLRFNHPMAVMILDIDHFKQVNDTWGHLAGDEVLKAIAQVCARDLRTGDSLGRLGGEEFAIILPETGLKPALQAAERLRQGIAALEVVMPGGALLRPTASIGVTLLDAGDDDISSLLHRADLAMYQAKRAGRNRVVFFDRVDAAHAMQETRLLATHQ